MENILFICTGNTCRSPMAAAMFNRLAGESGAGARAASAGLHVFSPGPASDRAVLAAAELGADLRGHLSRQVTPAILAAADRIYTMTRGHAAQLRAMAPSEAHKIGTLAAFDIPDPFGGSMEDYRRAAKEIYEAVRDML